MVPLPVDSLLSQLTAHLQTANTAVIQAPPGSGKTTRIAPALVESGLVSSQQRIYLLQPRRVAAVATAQRIAAERNWQIPADVGYHVRFDKQVTNSTPLVVATEGILLQQIANDPTLDEVGAVILDEFHERSINADLLLSMLRQIQTLVRNDLRLLVMSATLETTSLVDFLQASVFQTTGTLHPVTVTYRPPAARQRLADHVAETVQLTAEKSTGDILVFLPGVGEIHQVAKQLQPLQNADCHVLPLHGSQPLEQQAAAIRQTPFRKIILATNVAETSLTIEGIRSVIDPGQVRIQRYDPAVGLDRLQLEPICQASAQQRAGRAGRIEAGRCIRLWDERSHRSRPEFLDPEIRRIDLSAAVLQILSWGESLESFPWFEPPRADALKSALQLLIQLQAVCPDSHRITRIGQAMSRLPTTPRIARMLLESQRIGFHQPIATVAAMLSERDPFLRPQTDRRSAAPPTRHAQRWPCDVTQRFLALQSFWDNGTNRCEFGEVHRSAAQTIRKVTDQFLQMQTAGDGSIHDSQPAETLEEAIGRAILAGFPDRLARRRKPNDDRAIMVGGRGVRLSETSGVRQSDLFLCVDVDDRNTEALVRQASGIDAAWLPSDLVQAREDLFFNPSRQQVEARQRRYWFDLILDESPAAISDTGRCATLLFQEASRHWEQVLPAADNAFHSWRTRMECLQQWAPELNLPVCDSIVMEEILQQLCSNRSFAELRSAPWLDWLQAKLTSEQLRAISQCPNA
ncbi:MAG: helicase-related protein [Pirellulaceae bacterium]